MSKYALLGTLYDRHKPSVSGQFHNALWQIMIHNSCEGAFTTLHDGQLIVSLREGGYVPTGCYVSGRGESICDDLNANIFGLLPSAAWDVVAMSMRKPTGPADLVTKIKEHAEKNYNKGWDFIIECYTDDEIRAELTTYNIKSLRAWVKHMRPMVEHRNETIATGEW